MMRTGNETPEEEKERFGVSRQFGKRVKEILGDSPDIVFEHVGQATFPTSVFVVKPFGKVVICAGTTGYNLDFDVRYLWMRQKEILGSHFANAYECMKANELIESGLIRPVLWRTMGFDGVGEAHQLMRENQHLGKISILVGRREGGRGQDRGRARRDLRRGGRLMAVLVEIRWVANPFRGDKFEEGWVPGGRGGRWTTAPPTGPSTAPRTACSTSSSTRSSPRRRLGALLVLGRDRRGPRRAAGLYQVPLLPTFHETVGAGEAAASQAAT